MKTRAGATWALWDRETIPDSENPDLPYLKRLRLLQTPWFGVFVHAILEPDRDRHPHDHPWTFRSLILRGGYTEEIYPIPTSGVLELDGVTHHNRRPGGLHHMQRGKVHRIKTINGPTTTLVLVGRLTDSWGFLTEDGFINWREYLNEPDARHIEDNAAV